MKTIFTIAMVLCSTPCLAGNPIPVPSAEPTASERRILDAIAYLHARVDSLSASQAYPAPFAAECGSDGFSRMLESNPCEPSPPVVLFQQVAPAPLRMSEPPVLRVGRTPGAFAARRPVAACGSTGSRAVMSSAFGDCASGYSAPTTAAAEGFNWRTGICDILRRRTVRDIGPYQIEVRHGLLNTEVTVLP